MLNMKVQKPAVILLFILSFFGFATSTWLFVENAVEKERVRFEENCKKATSIFKPNECGILNL